MNSFEFLLINSVYLLCLGIYDVLFYSIRPVFLVGLVCVDSLLLVFPTVNVTLLYIVVLQIIVYWVLSPLLAVPTGDKLTIESLVLVPLSYVFIIPVAFTVSYAFMRKKIMVPFIFVLALTFPFLFYVYSVVGLS
jgi:hypothetical protein